MTNLEIIDEIKSYLNNFNAKKFYGPYEYKGQKYKASNLLFSLLISERFDLPFTYEENINIDVFTNKFSQAVFKNPNDFKTKKAAVSILKEILDITDQIVKLNGITFSFHELLTKQIDLSDLKNKLKNDLNDDMRKSLPLLDETEKETLNRFKEIKSPISKLIQSKARGNQKQLAQQFLTIGYKVDNQSNILSTPIYESLIDGLKNEKSYYVQSVGCRNAIVQGTNAVASSGYLNRKLSFGTIDIMLSDEDDCHTDKYLEVDITNANAKIVLNGRYVKNEKDNSFTLVNLNNINNFIGKKVKLRSPVTCKSKDGICKTCYGILSTVNKSLSIGLIAATTIAEKATQETLSTKHLLFASILKDNPTIMQYIHIDHMNDCISCIKPFTLKYTDTKKLFFIDNSNNVYEEFRHSFKDLYIHNERLESIQEEFEKDFIENDIVFTNIKKYVNMDMNMLMKTLNRTFEKTSFMKEINDYNQYYFHMLEMLMQLGNIASIHVEIILSLMMKVRNNHSLLWRQHQDKDLEIVSIRTSNLSNNLFSSILFERVRESLLDFDNYNKDKAKLTKYEQLFGVIE